MLVSSKQMVLEARAKKYAIGCFNTSDLEITKAIIKAAEAQKAPVIIATSPKAIEYAGLETLSSIVKSEAENTQIPVALHLDHGVTLNMVEDCLNIGYTSVMFDGSGSELEHNEILTRQAVEMAHSHDVPCEGELGSLGKAGENPGQLTNPGDVIEFVQKTNIDFLAVSIGSEHGIGKNEKLDIELLKKINALTHVPLVLHGASGVSDQDIKAAIKNGIAKINIDTDIRHTFSRSIREILAKNTKENDPREILTQVMVDIQKLIEEKIKLFGSNGKT
jgi:fructose-bisphosphate aldolase class II